MRRTLLGLALAALVAGCSTTDTPSPPPAPPPSPPPAAVASVTVSPTTGTLVPQATTQLAAEVRDASGNVLSGRTITWASTADLVATVSSAGLVTGATTGQATISAESEGKSGSAVITVKDGAMIGAAGGTASTADGRARVTIPAGALSATTMITIEPRSGVGSSPLLATGTVYELGPSGTQFAQPATVRIRFDPASLPNGVDPSALRLEVRQNDAWSELAGSTVDLAANAVEGPTPHFSLFALLGALSHIYVGDGVRSSSTNNGRVVRIDDITGNGWASWGTPGTGADQYQAPEGVAVDGAGRIYVADGANHRISAINGIGGGGWTSFSGVIGNPAQQLNEPRGIAVQGGKIYISDWGTEQIIRIDDLQGNGWIAYKGNGLINRPIGIFVDPAGVIYVVNSGNNTILRMTDISGAGVAVFGGFGNGVAQFEGPRGVTVNSAGQVFVADEFNNRVVRFDATPFGSNWVELHGQAAPGTDKFNGPTDVAADAAGLVYVTQYRDSRIIMIDANLTGNVWTSFGAPGGQQGQFGSPFGIATR